MAEKRKRRSPWPKTTLHTLYFAVGCTMGLVQSMAFDLEDPELTERVHDLLERLEQASMWPQREAREKLCPLMRDVGKLIEVVSTPAHERPYAEAVRQIQDQLRQFLPPDVQF